MRRSPLHALGPRLKSVARDWVGPATGPRRIRVLRMAVVLLLAGHLLFGMGRLIDAGYLKRLREALAWHRLGEVAYQFRDTDAETQRIAAWLCETVPADQVVLYTGKERGYLQILAALLAPRLLVRASAVPAGAHTFLGRPVFEGRPPWQPSGASVPVVEGCGGSLRLLER